MANKLQEQLYQELTDKVIQAIESGNFSEWLAKFASAGLPRNPISKKPYQGGNVLNLMFQKEIKKYTSNCWMTFKQIKDAGGSVKQGEKSTTVWFWQINTKTSKEDGKDGKDVKKTIPLLKLYYVFNLDQTEGLDKIYKKNAVLLHSTLERITQVEDFISNIAHKVETHFGTPCYVPSKDLIKLPPPESLLEANIEEYYATYFHELAHWTGHSSRLTRKQSGRFGSDDYAYEELIAELSSLFLCAEFGFTSKLQHTDYLAGWLKILKNDTSFIVFASQSAEQSIKFLKEQGNLKEKKVA